MDVDAPDRPNGAGAAAGTPADSGPGVPPDDPGRSGPDPYGPGSDEVADWLSVALSRRHAEAAVGLAGAGAEEGAGAGPGADLDGLTAPVALREVRPATVLGGAIAFAAKLSGAEADAWFRCYTRTVFLFGNPANLAARFPPALVTADGAAAWLGLLDRRRTSQLRRLLKPVSGVLPDPAHRWDTATGPAPAWELRVAVRGLDLPRYLVHLHHLAAEAVLAGVLAPAATVALRHVPDLDPGAAARRHYVRTRVHPAGGDGPPRLYAALLRTED